MDSSIASLNLYSYPGISLFQKFVFALRKQSFPHGNSRYLKISIGSESGTLRICYFNRDIENATKANMRLELLLVMSCVLLAFSVVLGSLEKRSPNPRWGPLRKHPKKHQDERLWPWQSDAKEKEDDRFWPWNRDSKEADNRLWPWQRDVEEADKRVWPWQDSNDGNKGERVWPWQRDTKKDAAMIDFGLGKETLKKIPQARKPKTTSPGVRRQHLKEQRGVEQLGGLKRQTRCNFRKQETKNDFKMFNKVQRGVKTYTVVLHCLLTCPLINLKFV
ncbi:hypothetical protein AWC38_SpisGene3911 [Stylophora pistillata]|uniref:Uncharacterized protein n=1 Tax=Stylophora pistillata TaxID=50429 RepID=A0A2B4SRZ4_STYPI|nr:hypothetical protein AWC38_SpisGene3911 [Stylophora pistillata]